MNKYYCEKNIDSHLRYNIKAKILLVLVLCIVTLTLGILFLSPGQAYASQSSEIGATVNWALYEDGTFVINGDNQPSEDHGEIYTTSYNAYGTDLDTSYSYVNGYSSRTKSIPWYNIRTSIKRVEFATLTKPKNMKAWFAGFTCCTEFDFTNLDVSNVTNMDSTFYGCTSVQTLDIANWNPNTSSLNTDYMFYNCQAKVIYCNHEWNTTSKNTFTVTNLISYSSGKRVNKENDLTGSMCNPSTGYFTFSGLNLTIPEKIEIGVNRTIGIRLNPVGMTLAAVLMSDSTAIGKEKDGDLEITGSEKTGTTIATLTFTTDNPLVPSGKVDFPLEIEVYDNEIGTSEEHEYSWGLYEDGSLLINGNMFLENESHGRLEKSGGEILGKHLNSYGYWTGQAYPPTELDVNKVKSIEFLDKTKPQWLELTNYPECESINITQVDMSECQALQLGGNEKLIDVKGLSDLNITSVIHFEQAFAGDHSLRELDLSSWNTIGNEFNSEATFYEMFDCCSALSVIYATDWTDVITKANEKNMTYEWEPGLYSYADGCSRMFGSCYSLRSINGELLDVDPHQLTRYDYDGIYIETIAPSMANPITGFFTEPSLKGTLPKSTVFVPTVKLVDNNGENVDARNQNVTLAAKGAAPLPVSAKGTGYKDGRIFFKPIQFKEPGIYDYDLGGILEGHILHVHVVQDDPRALNAYALLDDGTITVSGEPTLEWVAGKEETNDINECLQINLKNGEQLKNYHAELLANQEIIRRTVYTGSSNHDPDIKYTNLVTNISQWNQQELENNDDQTFGVKSKIEIVPEDIEKGNINRTVGWVVANNNTASVGYSHVDFVQVSQAKLTIPIITKPLTIQVDSLPSASITLSFQKQYQDKSTNEELPISAGQFNFTLTPLSSDAPMPAISSSSVTASTDDTGKVTFPAVEYAESGEWDYTVKENNPGDKNIQWDQSEHKIHVKVENGSSGLTATWTWDGEELSSSGYPVLNGFPTEIDYEYQEEQPNCSNVRYDQETGLVHLTIPNVELGTPSKKLLYLYEVNGSLPGDVETLVFVSGNFAVSSPYDLTQDEREALHVASANVSKNRNGNPDVNIDNSVVTNMKVTTSDVDSTHINIEVELPIEECLLELPDNQYSLGFMVAYDGVEAWDCRLPVIASGNISYETDIPIVTNYYAPTASLSVLLQKKYMEKDTKEELPVKQGQFSFTLSAADNNLDAPIPSNAIAETDANGQVKWDEIIFDKPGEWDYVVKENNPNNNDIEWDQSEHKVHVSVTRNDDHTLSANWTWDGTEMKESITATIHPTYGWTYLKISDVELSDGIVSFNYNYMGVLFPMGGSTIFATSRDSSSTGIEFNEQPLQVQGLLPPPQWLPEPPPPTRISVPLEQLDVSRLPSEWTLTAHQYDADETYTSEKFLQEVPDAKYAMYSYYYVAEGGGHHDITTFEVHSASPTVTNYHIPYSTWSPEVQKQVIDDTGTIMGEWDYLNNPFQFTLGTTDDAPLPSVVTATTDENGLASWGDVQLQWGKTYHYTVSEVKGDAANVKYDTKVHELTVTVDEHGTVSYTWDGGEVNSPSNINDELEAYPINKEDIAQDVKYILPDAPAGSWIEWTDLQDMGNGHYNGAYCPYFASTMLPIVYKSIAGNNLTMQVLPRPVDQWGQPRYRFGLSDGYYLFTTASEQIEQYAKMNVLGHVVTSEALPDGDIRNFDEMSESWSEYKDVVYTITEDDLKQGYFEEEVIIHIWDKPAGDPGNPDGPEIMPASLIVPSDSGYNGEYGEYGEYKFKIHIPLTVENNIPIITNCYSTPLSLPSAGIINNMIPYIIIGMEIITGVVVYEIMNHKRRKKIK